jgi:transcription termination/antitermination protein NusG
LPEISEMAEWFALTVRPRHEKTAAQNLRMRGLEDFLPLYNARRQWSDRIQTVELPLFPGYVFCRFHSKDWLRVLGTPGVSTVVGFGKQPAPVSGAEIDAIQKMLTSGMRVSPWPYIQAGTQVEIAGGALSGLRGIALREKGVDRLVVNVELLRRSVAVEIDRALLTPLRTSRAA